ncbi:hypothetical protein HKX48_002811, partial [Thoreauomyces humboldtii]
MKLTSLLGSTLTVLAAAGVVDAAHSFGDYSACTKTIVRKEVHDMSLSEWNTYIGTIQTAMTTPSTTNPGITMWEDFAKMHNQYQATIHGNSAFILWHRWFTFHAEQALQKINPKFVFPYWATERQYVANDWAKDAIWGIQGQGTGVGTDVIGGAWEGFTARVVDADPAAATYLAAFKDAHIKRAYALNTVKGVSSQDDLTTYRFASLDDYNNIYQECLSQPDSNGFHCWANRNEWLHGTFHVINGGADTEVGQMATMYSTIDPLFFLHHANIDRLYDNAQAGWKAAGKSQAWQINGSCPTGLEAADENQSPKCLSLKTALPGFPLTVNDVQFSSQLCVKYQAPVRIPTSAGIKNKRAQMMPATATAAEASYPTKTSVPTKHTKT